MMRKAPVKLDFEKLARYRPPGLVTLYIALLKGGQMTCLFATFILTLRYFKLTGYMDVTWLILVTFLTFLASFYRHLWLEEHYVADSLFAKLGEFIIMVIAIRLVLIAFGQITPLINLDFIYYVGFMTAAWYSGLTFLHQFYNLYLQPYEVSEEEGGVPALGDQYHLSYDHTQAYRELKTNFRWLGGVEVVAVLGGVGLINQFGEDANKSGSSQTLVLLGGIYLMLGLPLLAWARMRYLRTIWQLDKLKEPSHLVDRWAYYVGGLILLVVIVTFAISSLGGVYSIPLPAPGSQEALPSVFYPPTAAPMPTPPPLVPPKNVEPPFRLDLAWLGVLIQVLGVLAAAVFLVVILWYAFSRLVQSGWVGPQWKKIAGFSLFKNLRDLFRNLFGSKRQKDPFEKEAEEGGSRFDPFGWFRRENLPDDPRGRVRFYYRQVAQRAGRAGLPRRVGQTPAEYAGYLAPNLEEPQDQANLTSLTGLYEEARFSPHPVDTAQVETARESSQGLVAFFRQHSRRARIKPRE